MSSRQGTSDDLRAVADALRSHDRFLIVTHENPDGDALVSLLAMKLGLERLGKDLVIFLPGESGIPSDLSLLRLEGLQRALPADATDRVLLALDCANAARMGAAAELLGRAPLSIDVDHHHDNTRFATINLVLDGASSTGEIVAGILDELGRLIVSYLLRGDFEEFGVGEEYAEGIIDRIRAVDGTEMAAMIREPPEPPDAARRVSLRASHDEIDVSAIARKRGGGGHRQEAGFSSDESIEKI